MKKSFSATLASVLCMSSGCGVTPNIDSVFYPPPENTIVTLHRDIEVPAGKARTYIQDGTVVDSATPFRIRCEFEVTDVLDRPQKIHADTFTVYKVQREESEFVSRDPVMLAASFSAGMDTDSGLSDISKVRHLWLRSDSQPNVRRLSCAGVRTRPADAQFPTIRQIQETLGSFVTLELPATSGVNLGPRQTPSDMLRRVPVQERDAVSPNP